MKYPPHHHSEIYLCFVGIKAARLLYAACIRITLRQKYRQREIPFSPSNSHYALAWRQTGAAAKQARGNACTLYEK